MWEGQVEKGAWWEYAPTAGGKMAVGARDLAGNVVKEESGDQ
jgi:hypothetical protein